MIIDKKVPLVDAPLPPEGKVAYFTDDTGKFTIKDSDGNLTTPTEGTVNSATGNLYGAEDGSAIRYYTETINARQFGFRPGEGIDNTTAFDAYNAYLLATPPSLTKAVEFDAGIYYFTKWTIPGSDGSSHVNGELRVPSPKLIGQGKGTTRFVPLVSSETNFIELGPGRVNELVFDGIDIRGRGQAENPNQSGLVLVAKAYVGGDGGVTGLSLRNGRVSGFAKRQYVLKGGLNSATQSIDYVTIENFTAEREAGVTLPAVSVYGNVTQLDSIGTNGVIGRTGLKLGPNIHVAAAFGLSGSAVSTVTSNTLNFTSTQAHFYTTGQPVRVVNATTGTLPGTLTAGTTYYAAPTGNIEMRLATTVANAIAGTTVAIAAIGTATARIVPQWITNVNTTTGVFTANDDLLLSHGDGAIFLGTNLPTGITAGADVFLRPITNNTFYVYNTVANALAGGTTGRVVPTTTGTLTDFGFCLGSSATNPSISPANIELGLVVSTESEVGLLVDIPQGNPPYVGLRPSFSNLARGIEARGNAQVFVHGGEFNNAASATYGPTTALQTPSLVTADGPQAIVTVSGSPRIQGTTTRYATKRIGGDFRVSQGDSPIVPTGVLSSTLTGTTTTLANGATIITNYNSYVIVNCGLTAVNTISSRLMPGAFLTIRPASSATTYLDFITGDNLYLNGRGRIRVKANQTITFRMTDTGAWAFVSLANSNDEVRVNVQSTTATAARNITSDDVGGLVICSGTTAYALTIPTDATLALGTFHVGEVISLYQSGTGQVSFVADTANGVTLRKAANIPDSLQYNVTTIMKIGANEWTYI